jgi:hypothetical protein
MKAKIFNIPSNSAANSTDVIELQMNEWLVKQPNINITNMVFNGNEHRFILIMFYTENKL